jgi:crossover junction endodeoxyribonuclease RuvC
MARYLGLDLSLSSPGFAVIEVTDGVPHLLHASHRKTNAKQTHGQRLEDIAEELQAIILTYKPFAAVIRERGFSRHQATTQTLFKVVGISDMITAHFGYSIEEIPPTTVKKLVTGDGKADKAEVERAVRRWLTLPADYTFAKDDESDAVAVVLAYLIQNEKISV